MRFFDLQPTQKNIIETFERDLLGRNIDILRFIELLNAFECGGSLALDAQWGAGKTFFVKQVKMVLDAFNDHITTDASEERTRIRDVWGRIRSSEKPDIEPQVSVYYDAWLNDNDDDPILSLVYTILESISTDYKFENIASLAEAAAGILELFTGRGFAALVEGLRKKDPLVSIREKKDIHKQIAAFLDSLLAEQGNRLIIFVDELDRCKPTFAVRLLERIKHYFASDRIVFVFAVNVGELQHTIRQCYGMEFNASRYLDRFFDFRVELPPVSMEAFYQAMGLENGMWLYDKICKEVIRVNNLSLREASKFYRLAKTAAHAAMYSERNMFVFGDETATQFVLMCVLPVMLGLKVNNKSQYDDFVSGKDSTPLHSVIGKSDVAPRLLRELLAEGETYRNGSATDFGVDVSEKIEDVYRALFIHQYTNKNPEVKIGALQFSENTRRELLKAASGLSYYADYHV